MRAVFCMIVAACWVSASHAENLPEPVAMIIERLTLECQQAQNGSLDVRVGAISPQPLLGFDPLGLHTGWVVDERHIICNTLGARHNCGTGGCPIHFVAAGEVTTDLARGWRLTEMHGRVVMLLEIHGGRCNNASGATACFKALTWNREGRARSVETVVE